MRLHLNKQHEINICILIFYFKHVFIRKKMYERYRICPNKYRNTGRSKLRGAGSCRNKILKLTTEGANQNTKTGGIPQLQFPYSLHARIVRRQVWLVFIRVVPGGRENKIINISPIVLIWLQIHFPYINYMHKVNIQ